MHAPIIGSNKLRVTQQLMDGPMAERQTLQNGAGGQIQMIHVGGETLLERHAMQIAASMMATEYGQQLAPETLAQLAVRTARAVSDHARRVDPRLSGGPAAEQPREDVRGDNGESGEGST